MVVNKIVISEGSRALFPLVKVLAIYIYIYVSLVSKYRLEGFYNGSDISKLSSIQKMWRFSIT